MKNPLHFLLRRRRTYHALPDAEHERLLARSRFMCTRRRFYSVHRNG